VCRPRQESGPQRINLDGAGPPAATAKGVDLDPNLFETGMNLRGPSAVPLRTFHRPGQPQRLVDSLGKLSQPAAAFDCRRSVTGYVQRIYPLAAWLRRRSIAAPLGDGPLWSQIRLTFLQIAAY
jgi:hypothetical protein